MSRFIRSSVVVSLVAVLLLGCELGTGSPSEGDGGGGGDGSAGPGNTTSALVAQSFAELPPATPDNAGQLYYVIDEGQFYYSDGAQYIAIDLSGEDGQDGQDGRSANTVYEVYDNSNDLIGLTTLGEFPATVFTVTTSTGHVFSWFNSNSTNYAPYNFDIYFDGASQTGSRYAQAYIHRPEAVTAYQPSTDTWYVVDLSAGTIPKSSVTIRSREAGNGAQFEITDDSGFTFNLMRLVPRSLAQIGLPPFDPPFTIVAQP